MFFTATVQTVSSSSRAFLKPPQDVLTGTTSHAALRILAQEAQPPCSLFMLAPELHMRCSGIDLCRIGNAATLGFKMVSAATNPATKHGGMHAIEDAPNARRLAAAGNNNYRPDVGAMDTASASAAAISKAVIKPNVGSAKFATHVGISEGQVASGTRKHGG